MTSKAYLGTICFIVVLLLLICPHSHAASSTSVKLALIADKAFDLDKSPLVSLLEVELSQKDDIKLLERAQIRQVLEEQELSLTGLLQRNRTIQIGQLLRVDAFVLLSIEDSAQEKQNQKRLLRVRVTETAHGLRLLDTFEELDSAKLEEIVERITEKVTAIVPKMILPPGEAIPVGIVDIHRVQLGESYQWLARTLPTMLSVRLGKEPRIIMLEREDLKILHDEKLLAEGEDTEFWGSAVLVEGYLRRRGVEDVEIKLSLRRASGEEMPIFTALVEPNEPLEAVEKATNNIIQELLNAPPATSWQPKQEAEEFFRQGQLLRNHKRHKDALPPLETAHALQPDSVFYTGAIFRNAWEYRNITEKSFYSDLELADLVSILVRQIREGYTNGAVSQSEVLLDFGQPLGYGSNYIRYPYIKMAGYFARAVSVSTDKIRHINRENRKIFTETTKKATKNWEGVPTWFGILQCNAWLGSDKPEEIIQDLKDTCRKLVTPRDREQVVEYIHFRILLFYPKIDPYNIKLLGRTHLKGNEEEFRKLWFKLLEELTNDRNSLIKLTACLALSKSYNEKLEKINYCSKALNILFEELNSPNEPVPDKWFLRRDVHIALRLSGYMDDEKRNINTFVRIYDPLLKDNDVPNTAMWTSVFHHQLKDLASRKVTDIKTARLWFHFLERIKEVLQGARTGDEYVVLNNVNLYLEELRRRFPELDTSEKPANVMASVLLKEADWPNYKDQSYKYTRVLQEGNILWVAFAEPGLGLAEINLSQKKVNNLWHINCENGTTLFANIKGAKLSGPITGMTIDEQSAYVAIRDVGLFEFQKINKKFPVVQKGRKLTEKDGLPAVSITGMALVRHKLWIAYGGTKKESGLVIYDSENKTFDTVFCSTLDGTAPFGVGESYALSFLTPGPEDKLFFILGERGFVRKETSLKQWRGLWKIDTKMRETKFLWRDDSIPMIFEAIQVSDDNWWFQDKYSLTRFDPNSEKAFFIFGRTNSDDPGASTVLRPVDPMPELQRNLFVPESSMEEFRFGHLSWGHISLRTAAIHGDRIWARLGKSQIIIIHKGKGFDDAEVIDNNILDGDKVLRFFSTPYGLVAIGEGTVGLIETKISEK